MRQRLSKGNTVRAVQLTIFGAVVYVVLVFHVFLELLGVLFVVPVPLNVLNLVGLRVVYIVLIFVAILVEDVVVDTVMVSGALAVTVNRLLVHLVSGSCVGGCRE